MARSTFEKILFQSSIRLKAVLTFDANYDRRNTVLICSAGRSGSTMLANVVNYNNEFRYIFEPFKADRVRKARDISYPMYLDPAEGSDRYGGVIHSILDGRVSGIWVNSHNNRILSEQRLIKSIRANMLLPWIAANAPEVRHVLLIRNPMAVVESWVRAKWQYIEPKQVILSQAESIADLLPAGSLEMYFDEKDPVANQFYNWAIQHVIALRSKGGYICHFEDIVGQPEKELPALLGFLGVEYRPEALNKLREPSRTTRKDSKITTNSGGFLAWKERLDDASIKRGQEILEHFGLAGLYSKTTGMPLERLEKRPVA